MTALFNLIQKPRKYNTNIKNYKPIAFINANLRLLSIILNNRLRTVLEKLTGKNHQGFIPNRQYYTNIRRFNEFLASIKALVNQENYFTKQEDLRILLFDCLTHTSNASWNI